MGTEEFTVKFFQFGNLQRTTLRGELIEKKHLLFSLKSDTSGWGAYTHLLREHPLWREDQSCRADFNASSFMSTNCRKCQLTITAKPKHDFPRHHQQLFQNRATRSQETAASRISLRFASASLCDLEESLVPSGNGDCYSWSRDHWGCYRRISKALRNPSDKWNDALFLVISLLSIFRGFKIRFGMHCLSHPSGSSMVPYT